MFSRIAFADVSHKTLRIVTVSVAICNIVLYMLLQRICRRVENMKFKLVKNLCRGDVVNSDIGVATILSCERARWIEVSNGSAFEIKYRINGQESSCIQSSKDRLEMWEK